MKKPSRMRKLLVGTIAFTMMMGAGTTAFASGGGRDHDDHDNRNKTRNYPLKLHFKDTQGKEYEWALRYIIDLASRRVFEGYDDGTFKPQATVTRMEAIAAAVRVMGLRDEAESAKAMATKLNFLDAAKVPAWAVGYVAVALENDLFGETESYVNPNQPADRLWATTLLVKALKLQNQAEAQMNAKLPFADSGSIPAGSVGYVKVAVDQGLVDGFEDNTFRPKQLVTRAQIAALLDRAGNQLPGNSDGLISGTILAPVTGSTVTISTGGQTSTLALDDDVFIFKNGSRVSTAALAIGDTVKIRYYNGSVIYLEVTQPGSSSPVTPGQAVGVRSGMVAAAVANNRLTLVINGQSVALPLQTNALFFRNGSQISASGLQIGDLVTTRSYNNGIVYVEVTQPAGSNGSQPVLSGTVSGPIAYPINNGSLTMTVAGEIRGYSLSSGAIVYRGGVLTTASSLQVGDVITAYTYNNIVAVIEVTQPVVKPTSTGDLTGTVVGPVANNVLTVSSGGVTYSLQLDPKTFVYVNGYSNVASALQAGSVVSLHYYNGVVNYVVVSQFAGGASSPLPSTSTATGSVISASGDTLVLVNGTQAQALSLDENAFIYRGGVKVASSSLQTGDVVKAVVYNNKVVYVEVTQTTSGAGQSFYISGTFNSLTFNNQGKIATISVNQTTSSGSTVTSVYPVSSSVVISGSMSGLVANHAIYLQGNGQVITSITIP
ncbi:S-layer homology domain-containing protein [Paenibacillus ferrarius]|uniref:S-layer homology domain-containing protein n=1 Tax=Paenibacillus ferrarius TaxID=1469647 RepID=UPI003D28351C